MEKKLDRKKAPPTFSPLHYDFNLLPINSLLLNNETKVYYLNDSQTNVIQIDLVFKAGNIFSSNILTPSFTNFLLKSGTAKKTSLEIDEILEHYGAYLERNCNPEYASISIKMLSKHVEKILPILREILTEAFFPEKEIELLKIKSKKSLELNLQKGDFIANKKVNEFLFGKNHPYGKNLELNDYNNIEQKEIKKFYQNFYLNGSCQIFIAGLLPKNLEVLLNQYVGDLPFNEKHFESNKEIEKSTLNKPIIIENNVKAVQSSIRIGRIFGNRKDPDFLKARILNIVLGGYFGSRLMKEIREQKGYTYGIYSYIQNNMQNCAWIISTETGKDVCENAIKDIYKEMQKLQQEKVNEEELLQVKNFYLGLIMGDIEGVLSIMNIWKSLILNNTDESFFMQNINTIKKITTTEIQEMAIKYLTPKDFIELVVN